MIIILLINIIGNQNLCLQSQIVEATSISPTIRSSNPPTVPGPLRLFDVTTVADPSSGRVNVVVGYGATPDHTTEWIGLRRNGGMWRTGQ